MMPEFAVWLLNASGYWINRCRETAQTQRTRRSS